MTIIRKTSLITSRKKPNNQNHLSHVELSEDDWKKYLRQDLNEFDIKQLKFPEFDRYLEIKIQRNLKKIIFWI